MLINDHLLGKSAAEAGDLDTAIDFYNSALRSNPEDWDCWLSLADAHQKLGRHNRAQRIYKYVQARRSEKEISDTSR